MASYQLGFGSGLGGWGVGFWLGDGGWGGFSGSFLVFYPSRVIIQSGPDQTSYHSLEPFSSCEPESGTFAPDSTGYEFFPVNGGGRSNSSASMYGSFYSVQLEIGLPTSLIEVAGESVS